MEPESLFKSGLVITSIKPSGKDGRRVAVRAGGKVVARLDRSAAERLGLRIGAPWNEPTARRAADEEAYAAARRSAIRLLTSRAKSRAELVRRLVDRGHARELAERAAAELAGAGLLDDRAYAESEVRAALSRKPAGRSLLEAMLREKGVGREVAASVVAEIMDERDPLADAIEVARRKAGTLRADLDETAVRRRLAGALARRGFDPDTARRAVLAVLERQQNDTGDATL